MGAVMADRHDSVTVERLKGEIADALRQASQALEARMPEEPGFASAIEPCIVALQRVRGSLRRTEFMGAALLAEEMERLAVAVRNKAAPQPAMAVKWLLQAIAQLPHYLDRMQLARRQVPGAVLPLINQLRGCRGEPPLTELPLPELSQPASPASTELPERAHLARPDPDALHSVLMALREELVAVKEQLDAVMLADRLHTEELDKLLPPLRQIANALAVLGFAQPRKVIIDQLSLIQGLAQGARLADDAVLMDVAGALLYVEATLAGMSGPVEDSSQPVPRTLPGKRGDTALTDIAQARHSVIHETRLGLQQARDWILGYIQAQWDHQRLQPLPALLTQLRGALAMIQLNRAAAALEACNQFVKTRVLAGPARLIRAELEHLADAVTGIDYYLEGLNEGSGPLDDNVLGIVESALTALGCPPTETCDEPAPLAGNWGRAQQPDLPDAVLAPGDLPPALNPPAVNAPASLLPPPLEDEQVDDELREVFLEEADEVLATLRQALPGWLEDPSDKYALIEMRRAFHTLKGSGRMVRALILGELAWAAENLLNRVVEGSIAPDPQVRRLVEDVFEVLPSLIDEFAAQHQRQRNDVDRLAARAHALALGEEQTQSQPQPLAEGFDPQLLTIFHNEALAHLASLSRFLAQNETDGALPVTDELQRALHTLKGSASMAGILPIAELVTPLDLMAREWKARQLGLQPADRELLEDAQYLIREKLLNLASDPLAAIAGASRLRERIEQRVTVRLALADTGTSDTVRLKHDAQLIARFLEQGMDILLDAESLLLRWRQHPGERQELGALLDELTTLGEAAHMADLFQVDELCEALLDLYGAVEESSLPTGERFFAEAERAHEALICMLDQVAAGQQVQAQPALVQALRRLLEGGLDPTSMGVVARDGSGITELETATRQLGQALDPDDELMQIFLEEATDILQSVEQAMQRWLANPDNPAPALSIQRDLHTLKGGARLAGIELMGELVQELEVVYEAIAERRFGYSGELRQLLRDGQDCLLRMLRQLRGQSHLEEPIELIETLAQYRRSARKPEPAAAPRARDQDTELLEVFLEEGLDIVESSGAALLRWQADPQNGLEAENLLRDLHTLKGGARMVEIAPLGDLAHEMESLYEQLCAGQLQSSAKLFELLQSGHDRLAQMLDAVRLRQPVAAANDLLERIRGFGSAAGPAPEPDPAGKALPAEAPVMLERGATDVVKVAAELLDELGNLAGEASIVRGRVEQQINDAQTALGEMEITLERMREQLRRLDTETQGRILSREQVDSEQLGYEEFDPLEMDRHSQLQQVSRALFESASDLLDLKETLAARNQEAQTLLVQQARVNTDLQEGLMRTRMVPFERLVPRLQRVVRQVASELGKRVEFEVGNAQGEMDRSVLERMLAPLEHMLRNAVDHGLEPTEARRAAGKPEQGLIRLSLRHEGSDIIIEMSDDGAGVPLEAVRAKALKRGLIDASSELSDQEVLQFILQPGFSTAAKVTQISGRGLGMDVVHEEVKQLGGSMHIESATGQGTRFEIRLPFTVAVNRALMVQCGDEQYAIGLNSIAGIVRVPPIELQACYQLDPPQYRYGGRTYELRYLGELLQGIPPPGLTGQGQPLSVLLVHAHDHQVAVQVDALNGSRDIVVKSLGPQFAAVRGLVGGTLLGDGRVVLIIDLLGQVRAFQARHGHSPSGFGRAGDALAADTEQARPLSVLVVDDSVTVRKVTGRMLERHGMSVLTAKDGVDALELMREQVPDVVLLDIEMPRMDGFEVAARMRQDERLKHLPIIMITSRTGQKHRDRAMAIGVNEYLGKPYQESALLDTIVYWSQQHA